MITVQLNKADFEYDIHSLVKAFFPQEEVQVSAEEKDTSERISFRIDIEYRPASVAVQFWKNDKKGIRREFQADFSDRKETKNRLKQQLYDMLSEFSKQKLPWGTLTGIRPTKIPMSMLEEGKSREQIETYMRETYFASQEKIDLCIEVAEEELKLLQKIDYENGYSLYIGIPFCPSTCLYCSFTSYPLGKWESRIDEYLDALEKEIEFTAERFKNKHLNTIYIGGGTPTTLTPRQLDRLITKLEQKFDFSHLLEFTVEAGRADSITEEKLKVIKDHGISRISINPQTMKQETLDLIGRKATVKQTVESFQLARRLGFTNINMDLIVGLPEENIDDVRNTMEQLKELDPDNITVHSLAVKRAARLRMNWEEYQDLHMENTWDIIDLTARYARNMGMTPYYLYRQKNMAGNFENVGYAKPGCAGIYNILIMEEKQTIMALGAGATTKFVMDGGARIERVGNVKDITNYLERIDEMIERKAKEMEELNWH
ncbi:Oxygen-independent coproporphyrinogen-III oxidase 2 [uncultured Roseburia sp.]|uniref:Coproporphyrinogen dehydrogenase HemZ n=1 Tax=Brotonthovivens ammoniilytica TaxID=2981725 RepID=A0ABT2TI43_9FIRM|nr:coproporphyrinogen dehydrogenase HemZ [Brotonthovivens ammoniilytica]MCU6761874.1 coproporphyrinogen dehydrogenase HemZ [Brotonthovivens ammoniilytica]SCI49207.1 Oxygen-independent coproporphyrinogen-III oxidase 2 [uncultured Roseburia sp.]